MTPLVNSLGFAPDQFRLDYGRILDACSDEAWIPGRRGYVLAPTAHLEHSRSQLVDLPSGQLIAPDAITRIPNPLWERGGYSVARYACPQSSVDEHALQTSFRTAMIAEEIAVLREAVDWCRRFLASRTCGTQPLLRLPTVAQAQAKVVAELHLLRELDLNGSLATPGGRRALCDQVASVCEQLIKLVGGRAMLSGHMVHVTTLFTTLNRLYVEDAA